VSLLAGVLGADVRLEGQSVGEVTGIVCDAACERVIGLDVRSVDGHRRFLPWIGLTLEHGIVTPSSRLVLVEVDDLEGYSKLGASILRRPEELSLLTVERDGRIGAGPPAEGVSAETVPGTPAL
jgi:hypothetical protein